MVELQRLYICGTNIMGADVVQREGPFVRLRGQWGQGAKSLSPGFFLTGFNAGSNRVPTNSIEVACACIFVFKYTPISCHLPFWRFSSFFRKQITHPLPTTRLTAGPLLFGIVLSCRVIS